MNEDELIIPADDTVAENTNEEETNNEIDDTAELPTFIEDVKEDDDDESDTKDESDAESDTESEEDEKDAVVEDVKPEPLSKENDQEVADPGDFKPNDYSYDVTLADGTVIKIEKPEDIKNIPADADFGTPQALFEASANYIKMINGIDADKRAYDAEKEKFDSDKTAREKQEKFISTTIAEMNYLESKGKLPKYDAKYDTMDWNDPKVAETEGIKERLKLLTYRDKENQQRIELGLSEMSLIEAQMQMEQELRESKEKEIRDRKSEQRKVKGAMVGGNIQSDISDGSEDDMIIGAGGNIRDIR